MSWSLYGLRNFFSLMPFHCKFNFRREFILSECHLTALEKIFAVMVLFSGVNPVIINFEYVKERISEKYLSLYSIVDNNTQHTYVTVVGLTLKRAIFNG
jgi:hypothetical protein